MPDSRKMIALVVAGAASIHPTYVALFVLIVIDILSGLAKGVIQQNISSDASRKGMTKKAMMLLIVAAAEVSQRLLKIQFPIDLGVTLGMFYCVTEIISILENAQACGVPLPDTVMKHFKAVGENK